MQFNGSRPQVYGIDADLDQNIELPLLHNDINDHIVEDLVDNHHYNTQHQPKDLHASDDVSFEPEPSSFRAQLCSIDAPMKAVSKKRKRRSKSRKVENGPEFDLNHKTVKENYSELCSLIVSFSL